MGEILLIAAVNAALAVSCAAGTAAAFSKNRRPILGKTAAGTLLAAGAFQIGFFGLRGLGNGILPIYNLFEVFFALALCLISAFLFLRIVWEIRVPAIACALPAFVLSLIASLNKTFWDVPGAESWLPVHVGLLILGVAGLGAAGIAWALYLLQDFALRRHHADDTFASRLPDLLTLDRAGMRLLSVSIVFFVAGISVGLLNIFAAKSGLTLFVFYKTAISAAIVSALVSLYFLRKRRKISARAGTVFGLIVFAAAVILIGGIDGMHKFSERTAGTEMRHAD